MNFLGHFPELFQPAIDGGLASFLQFRGGALYLSSARSRPAREQVPKNRSAFGLAYFNGGVWILLETFSAVRKKRMAGNAAP